jgi:hypothetical protein
MAVEPWEKKRLDELPAAIAAARGLEAQSRTPEQDAELD